MHFVLHPVAPPPRCHLLASMVHSRRQDQHGVAAWWHGRSCGLLKSQEAQNEGETYEGPGAWDAPFTWHQPRSSLKNIMTPRVSRDEHLGAAYSYIVIDLAGARDEPVPCSRCNVPIVTSHLHVLGTVHLSQGLVARATAEREPLAELAGS